MTRKAIAIVGAGDVGVGFARAFIAKWHFAMPWIHMAIKRGHGRSFAFARLRR